MAKVVVTECKEYDPKVIEKNVAEIFNTLKFNIKKNSSVLLKPNVLIGVDKSKAVTTHPEFLRGIIYYLKKRGGKIIVGDSSSATGEDATKAAFAKCGITEMANEEKVELIALEKDVVKKKIKGLVLKEIFKPAILDKVDYIINVPKMKTHSLMRMTGAIKNMYGTIPGGQKVIYHNRSGDIRGFANLIIDIYEANKPSISIMDAIVGLEGAGPGTGGKPKQTGYILCSKNGYALDFVQEKIMGFKEHTAVVEQAIRRSLLSPDKVEVVGEFKNRSYEGTELMPSRLISLIPAPLMGFAFSQFTMYPTFDHDKCTKCGDCARVCPTKAIQMKGFPELTKNKCISCYCCHETCNYSAINLKFRPVGAFIKAVATLLKMT